MDTASLRGTPGRGLSMATLGFAAGLTSIVFYGVAGPTFKERLGLSGATLGLLLSSPHLSKALLRIPFGAWVDEVGGRRPFLILLGLMIAGMTGLVIVLFASPANSLDPGLYPLLLILGLLGGAGGATFSVGVPQTAFWFPAHRQGYALGVYAGAGNIAPGLLNYLIPLLLGAVGLAGAYLSWLVLLVLATGLYAVLAVDSYYFQLVQRGASPAKARKIAVAAGQNVVPSGSARASLAESARTPRTWVLVMLYTVSFGGGFTALAAWLPTYWRLYHHLSLSMAGLLAGVFTVYGSLVRIPGGNLSDRFGGETVAMMSFGVMVIGAAVLTVSSTVPAAFVGTMVLATGMGVANAAIFKLVPAYVPNAVGGASGWIGGIGGAGTLVILPVLGAFVDALGPKGYALGFSTYIGLSVICVVVAWSLQRYPPAAKPF